MILLAGSAAFSIFAAVMSVMLKCLYYAKFPSIDYLWLLLVGELWHTQKVNLYVSCWPAQKEHMVFSPVSAPCLLANYPARRMILLSVAILWPPSIRLLPEVLKGKIHYFFKIILANLSCKAATVQMQNKRPEHWNVVGPLNLETFCPNGVTD